METLQQALEPYRHLDPVGWVGVYHLIPAWAGAGAFVLGVLMLLFGGGKLFRLVAGPLGAVIGAVWVSPLTTKLGLKLPADEVATVATIALALLGFLFPPGVMFFAFGVPTGLVAGQLAGPSDWMLGFVPGFVVGGAVGVVLHRAVGAVLSSAVGAWAVVLGAMATLAPLTDAVKALAYNPIPTLSIAGCMTLAGTVFQLFVRASPEEAAQRKQDRFMNRKKQKEQHALEERWANYSKDHKKAGDD